MNKIKVEVSEVKVTYHQPQRQAPSSKETEPVEQQTIIPQQVPCVDIEPAGNLNEINECVNTPVTLDPIDTGVVAKIPVVLAELTIRINLDSVITLPEPAIEIKQIKKRVKLTQCILLQDTNILFIKGFIRKNIDYASGGASDSQSVCGDLRHCVVDVPFSCTTPVTFNGTPPAPVVANTSTEFEYLREQDVEGPGFADKDRLLSGDLSEFNQISTEFYNELPYCELISSRVVEFDEYLNRRNLPGIILPFEEGFFNQIEEKMVVFLTLKLLQRRQVAINLGGSICRQDNK